MPAGCRSISRFGWMKPPCAQVTAPRRLVDRGFGIGRAIEPQFHQQLPIGLDHRAVAYRAGCHPVERGRRPVRPGGETDEHQPVPRRGHQRDEPAGSVEPVFRPVQRAAYDRSDIAAPAGDQLVRPATAAIAEGADDPVAATQREGALAPPAPAPDSSPASAISASWPTSCQDGSSSRSRSPLELRRIGVKPAGQRRRDGGRRRHPRSRRRTGAETPSADRPCSAASPPADRSPPPAGRRNPATASRASR